ncbi:MAG: MacB protein [SAR86 cluster bacterium]|jgi:putative ABC transport system permease protein|uniref:MacB protein n=1 Tax=SAR86 cluster bacterium TaxID=2030880 RepID=A0A368BWH3_9GAMM|nr:MAG: MacB protein [SAR86 cluster bacterium]|tara:strand:+ start:4516 stop:5724 length:1209 start_codon:yes stop_codon:yes gene_type:complete
MLVEESIKSAVSSIKTNGVRSFLTALAIIIGTAAVITVIGIGSSAEKALEASIDDLGPRTLSIFPSQRKRGGVSQGFNPLVIKDAEALAENTEHNWMIAPAMNGNRQIKFGNSNISGNINGYLPINFKVRGFEIGQGRIFTEKENLGRKRVIIIGSKVPGELKTSARQLLNNEILVAGTSYKVIGILKEEGSTGWQNPDDDLYVPLLTASQRIFGTDRLGWINVGISNETNVDYVMMTIEQILRQKHDIGPGGDNDFRINDWSQYSDLRRQATGIFTALIAGIAGISLIVGGIGVMNIMLVSVTERTREIGLRKALGATQKSIMMQFIIEAVLLCILGGILGIIIATSLLFLFTSINDWVFSMPFSAIIGSITFSALVGLFFGIWPARRAAKLDPAVSLRYE